MLQYATSKFVFDASIYQFERTESCQNKVILIRKVFTNLTNCCLYFFFPFALYILKVFNQRLITARDGWAHSVVNRWPREFFQSTSGI